ncbi:hypothetical protein HMPREF9134_00075 [Porphyromonas catoniae F0037]|uniref:Uncharacterized protein n=1 Tax=Porphyromonas catoniae F0037 TaxID=1127696 RepID=L1NIM3_9PORP|nr:hypothetical protein HMPREF9134_00075 [Porphyromonas catoniae F0037]
MLSSPLRDNRYILGFTDYRVAKTLVCEASLFSYLCAELC